MRPDSQSVSCISEGSFYRNSVQGAWLSLGRCKAFWCFWVGAVMGLRLGWDREGTDIASCYQLSCLWPDS